MADPNEHFNRAPALGVAPTVPSSLHKAVDTLLNTINSYRATLPQQVLERAQDVETAQTIAGVTPAPFTGVAAAQPIDRAAVFTIWQGMQYQGGIVTEAQAMQFAQQVLTAHGVGDT